jgi:release factor glutamine methyltransferase
VLSDISFEALQVAKENAIRHAVSDRAFFVNANMLDGLEPGFDLIVSNPPYVKSADLPSLQPEVEFEPLTALDGGSDGLLFINRLIASRQFLKPGGRILVEKGYDQNIEGYETLEDLDGVGRVIVI